MASSGTVIRRARKKSGLTQSQLAERMGTTQTAVARLERDATSPRLATVDRALRATGHRLELRAVRAKSEVDEAQIRAHLALTPERRVEAHDRARRAIQDTARGARRVR